MKHVRIATILLSSVLAGSIAHAAIPSAQKKATVPVPSGKAALMQATREALTLPIGDRMESLQSQGPQGYKNLVGIMLDDQQTMETRWKAVTAIGLIGGAEARPELERAMKRNEWYLRNAGLVAMVGADRPTAIKWARDLLNDKALIVRAAAVDALLDMQDRGSAPLLWKKLYSKENYRLGQSLFIRRRIVEALKQIEGPGQEQKFIAVLADKDETLHPHAIGALEKTTKVSLGEEQAPLKIRRELWQKWWKEKAQAKL